MTNAPTGDAPTGDAPLVWHYGLMAERWGEFLHDAPELPFLLEQIHRSGQPVLDLCCGAGRLTFPLKQAGIDVDGCDISRDMIEQARRRLATIGLQTNLYLKPEVLLMLQVAGFHSDDITIRGDYRDEPATAQSEKIVFIARRSSL